MKSEEKYLGIDIGGTAIKLGLMNEELEIIGRSETLLEGSGNPHVMGTVIKAIDSLLDEASCDPKCLAGMGVSAAGCVDKNTGSIAKNGGNVPGWSHTEVVKILEEKYGIPAVLINDGNAVALAESSKGAASGSSDVICIVIGTGIGGGIISGGTLIEGNRGFAGEIGHFPTHSGGNDRIYFENRASSAALVRNSVKVNNEWNSGRSLFGAALAGEQPALDLIDSWLNELTYGITGLVHIFNPEIVLIGGGVSAQEELLIKPLRDKVFNMIKPDFADGLEIKAASLGNDAGMIGAVCYLKERLEEAGSLGGNV